MFLKSAFSSAWLDFLMNQKKYEIKNSINNVVPLLLYRGITLFGLRN